MFFRRLRIIPARVSSPLPKSAMDAGSGIGLVGGAALFPQSWMGGQQDPDAWSIGVHWGGFSDYEKVVTQTACDG